MCSVRLIWGAKERSRAAMMKPARNQGTLTLVFVLSSALRFDLTANAAMSETGMIQSARVSLMMVPMARAWWP